MITYDDLTRFAPPASTKLERDDWFLAHGYDPNAVIRVGTEVATYRIADLVDGDRLSETDLLQAMTLACTFGFELALRCERGEAPELTPRNGNGAA